MHGSCQSTWLPKGTSPLSSSLSPVHTRTEAVIAGTTFRTAVEHVVMDCNTSGRAKCSRMKVQQKNCKSWFHSIYGCGTSQRTCVYFLSWLASLHMQYQLESHLPAVADKILSLSARLPYKRTATSTVPYRSASLHLSDQLC